MNKLKNIFKEHKLALLLAVLTTLVCAFPQIYFRIEHRADGIYQGIELLPDSPWSARVREVQDGHPNLGSIYYKEGKDDPYLFQPLGSITVAYMGEALGLDINNTILFSRLTLPLLAFFLLYGFVFLLSRNKLVALACAGVILLADSMMSPYGIKQLLAGMSPSSFLELARPVNSAMIFIPFFGFLISFWYFYRNNNWKVGAISAVMLALNFYNYVYTWTYLYAFGGILVLVLLLRKEWQSAKRVMSIFVAAAIMGIPYILNLYAAFNHPNYEITSLRFGVIYSHSLVFVGWSVVAALVAYCLWYPRVDRSKFIFGLSLLLAPFVTLNQQVITGKLLQEGHYHWYFHKPIAIIFLLLLLFMFVEKKFAVSYKKTLAIALIVISFASGIYIQTVSYYKDYPSRDGGATAIERQKYGPVMAWLNVHAAKEAVVFGNDEASHITVIYTPLNVFYHRAAIYQLAATKERLLDVIFSFYRLRDITAKEANSVFLNERGYISTNIYGMHYKEALGSYGAIPEQDIEDITNRYKETLKTPTFKWLERIFKKYEVEYVIWDKTKDPGWQIDRFSFLEKEFESMNMAIYKIKQ